MSLDLVTTSVNCHCFSKGSRALCQPARGFAVSPFIAITCLSEKEVALDGSAVRSKLEFVQEDVYHMLVNVCPCLCHHPLQSLSLPMAGGDQSLNCTDSMAPSSKTNDVQQAVT